MLNFDFLEKGLGLASPSHFVYQFSRKIFLMLHSVNWPNFIVWLPLTLEILDSICIVIIYCSVCGVIIFENNLSFLFKSFFFTTEKSGQISQERKYKYKCKYLKKEKSLT